MLKIGTIKLKWQQFPRSVRSKFINLINCRRKQPGSLKLHSAGPTFNYGYTHNYVWCDCINYLRNWTFLAHPQALSPTLKQAQNSDQLQNPQNAIKLNFVGSSLSVELFKVTTCVNTMILFSFTRPNMKINLNLKIVKWESKTAWKYLNLESLLFQGIIFFRVFKLFTYIQVFFKLNINKLFYKNDQYSKSMMDGFTLIVSKVGCIRRHRRCTD